CRFTEKKMISDTTKRVTIPRKTRNVVRRSNGCMTYQPDQRSSACVPLAIISAKHDLSIDRRHQHYRVLHFLRGNFRQVFLPYNKVRTFAGLKRSQIVFPKQAFCRTQRISIKCFLKSETFVRSIRTFLKDIVRWTAGAGDRETKSRRKVGGWKVTSVADDDPSGQKALQWHEALAAFRPAGNSPFATQHPGPWCLNCHI